MKMCSKCKIEKEDNDFAKDKTKKSGLSSQCKPCKQVTITAWNTANIDFKRAQAKRRYAHDRETLLAQKKEYYLQNRENIIKKNVNYKRQRRRSDLNFRLRENLRTRLFNAIRKHWKVGSAIQDLGCSILELKAHLEKGFTEGMTWENYGKNGWEIDHIKPLSAFDLTDRSQFLEACHYTNLQPLWASENYSKGAKYG